MQVIVILNGRVENTVSVTEETLEGTIAHFVELGRVVIEREVPVSPGWLYSAETDEFTPAENVLGQTWNLSKRAFKARFPRAKWVAAKAAAAVDPDVADFFEDFDLSSYINLQDPKTVGAVNALMQVGVPESFRLTAQETTTVLDVPCRPGEEP